MTVLDESILTEEAMLTTIDNPYDPFDEFELWLIWDVNHGYNSCGLLDRVARTSDALSDDHVIIRTKLDKPSKYKGLALI